MLGHDGFQFDAGACVAVAAAAAAAAGTVAIDADMSANHTLARHSVVAVAADACEWACLSELQQHAETRATGEGMQLLLTCGWQVSVEA